MVASYPHPLHALKGQLAGQAQLAVFAVGGAFGRRRRCCGTSGRGRPGCRLRCWLGRVVEVGDVVSTTLLPVSGCGWPVVCGAAFFASGFGRARSVCGWEVSGQSSRVEGFHGQDGLALFPLHLLVKVTSRQSFGQYLIYQLHPIPPAVKSARAASMAIHFVIGNFRAYQSAFLWKSYIELGQTRPAAYPAPRTYVSS